MADAILCCPRCGLAKPACEFAKQKQGTYCRPCDKAYKREHYLRNRQKCIERAAEWRAANPERKKANDAAWERANRERVNATKRAWIARNPEKRKATYTKYRREKLDRARANEAAYRERNRAVCNARIREWKRRNPDALVAYAGKRRAAELRAIPAWASLDAIAAVYRKAQSLGPGHHVDHCVPLISDKVCGFHCEANLQILTASENSRKNNRHWPDMWI